jgi:hypothetical protein
MRDSSTVEATSIQGACCAPIPAPSLFVLLVLATGCSDDDAGVAAREGTATTDDTGTTATTVELTGSPYKLVSVIDVTAQLQYPEMRAALQAVADEVNATGGIDGHPVEIEVCETHLDAGQMAEGGKAILERRPPVWKPM